MVDSFILTLPTWMKYKISESGRGLGHETPRIFGISSSISPKQVTLESSKLVHGFIFALPTGLRDISERGRGLGHVTPRKYCTPSTISRKQIKLETSNLVHSFILTFPQD